MSIRSRAAVWFCLTALYLWVTARFYRWFVFEQGSEVVYGIADDVYITASFGRTLLQGNGAVWYPGAPPVEGYTSPLWTVLVGLLHLAPGFDERALGLWVVVLNAILLTTLLWLVVHIVDGVRQRAGRPAWRLWMLVPVMLGGGALGYWSAEGFEVALVALLAVAGFAVAAFEPLDARRSVALGVLVGVAFWARMDSAVCSGVTCLYFAVRALRQRRLREVAMAASVAAAIVLLQFAERRLYYGQWLPNTYYLKVAGWPLAQRLALGLERDASLIPAASLPWLFLVLPPVRRALGRQAWPVTACMAAFSLSVAYSIHNGGDAWQLQNGHDRYTAVGAAFLLLGLGIVVAGIEARTLGTLVSVALCTAVALDPVIRQEGSRRQHENRLLAVPGPKRHAERKWIAYGRHFREISKPGARIAVCPAGAIVYFSHRGGVDLLGKIDPYIARLPATQRKPAHSRCWQPNPGHNKVDFPASFRMNRPEFSRHGPPGEFRREYAKLTYEGDRFFVRKGTPLLRREFRDQLQ